MARRSVSLPPELERAVRQLQARLLTTTDRDISFNEALNIALAASFSAADLPSAIDASEWSRLLKDSDWESDGGLSDIGKQALDTITPAGSGATRKPARARPQRKSARRASARPAPRTPRRVARAQPSAEAMPTSTDDGPVEAIAVEPIAATVPPTDDTPVEPPAAETAAEIAIEPEEVADDLAPVEPIRGSFESTPEDAAPDDAEPENEMPATSSIPLPSSWDEPIVAEVVDLPVDFDPSPRSVVDESTIPADELEPVDPDLVESEPTPESAPEPTSRWGGMGGMDLDALRQAIVGGETDLSEEPVARPPFQPSSPADDMRDFASRMSGFAADSEPIQADSVIVPEADIPSVEELLGDDDAVGEAEPVASDDPEAPAEEPAAAEPTYEEPQETPEDDEEPTTPPPADQAGGYSELDRALKDAAAAYEERLRNSGAT